MNQYTLADAAELAPEDVAALREEWGAHRLGLAVAYFSARSMRCDLKRGETRDAGGMRSGFTSWSAGDAARYAARPDWVFFDFFRAHVANACSRHARGLPMR